MANRQVFPASLFPLRGDVSAEAGATSVTVVGIQTIPVISGTPSGPYTLSFVNGAWTPVPIDTSIQVNGAPMSDDYDIAVNRPLGPASTPVKVNGSLV